MAKKKKKDKSPEIIANLKHTISMGGNSVNIEKLKEILKAVEEGTHVVKKRPGRRKSRKQEGKVDEGIEKKPKTFGI
tara:strand:+ start:647 stop:877 length:231 start_codon:yes stop_codon:yes gene_type:complete